MNAARARAARGDAALSELVGTVMVLGVTVMLVSVIAVQVSSTHAPGVDAPRLDVHVTATPGADEVTLQHRGGAVMDAGDLRVVIAVNGASSFDAAAGASGDAWQLGETLTLGPLSGPLTPGALLEVTIVHTDLGATLASTSSTVPAPAGSATAPTGFTLSVAFPGGTDSVSVLSPSELFVYGTVNHPNGRKSVASVTANFTALGGNAASPLLDDGTRGDQLPADGVFTGFMLVPPNATKGTFQVPVTATAFDGTRVTVNGTVVVTDTSPVYNTALIDVLGFRVMKFESNTGAGDLLTVHLKVRSWSEPVVLDDGTQWSLKRAYFVYDPFKPGNAGEIALSEGASGPNDWYHCSDTTTFVKAWKFSNTTVPKYDKDKDLLRYYFKFVWKQVQGGNSEHVDTLDTNERDQYFLLRRGEASQEVRVDGTWPSSWTDCSNT